VTTELRENWSWSVAIHVAIAILFFLLMRSPIAHFGKVFENIPVEVFDSPTDAEIEARSKRIVTAPANQETLLAKPDSYLSDKNRQTNEERSAKNPGRLQTAATTVQRKADSRPKRVVLSDLGVKLAQQAKKTFEQQRNWANQNTGEAIQGGEYIKGLREGEVSALNTKEFIFYSYYERVRQQLDQAWQPRLREEILKIYRLGRKLAHDTDYITRTVVTLNDQGEVVRVRMVGSSGTIDLDQIAIDALNRAGPYPNPPQGLINSSRQVEIRWDFILKT
jgi:TonB family protein